MHRKLATIAVLLLFSPLWVPLAALFVVVALFVAIFVTVYTRLWLVYFCWTHAGDVYLICSRRRGWEPFLRNNLIPVLPDELSAVWLEIPEPGNDVVHAGRIANVFLPKPFLIRVTRFRLVSMPLNSQLVDLKHLGAVSEVARHDAREILDAALAEPGKILESGNSNRLDVS